MTRIPRSWLPPVGMYHVTILGVDSTAIVRDDRDRNFLLGLFAREILERNWRILAWCLMDTHLHFIVECVLTSLSAGMQRMNGTHAQEFNRRHARRGHLFGDRFASTVIVDDDHLRNAIQYVLANPVAADLAGLAEDWSWSGAEHLFDGEDADTLDGHGRRRADRPRRAGAQAEGRHRAAAPKRARLHHRTVRIRQVLPGLRHDLRGGTAPLRGAPVGVRAAVPPDDAEARRRLHRRPQPGDLDRPEDDLAQPAL